LAVLFALGSALMYAFASVLQQRGASEQPADQALKLSLLGRLLRNPLWVVGLGCDVAGYGLQFLALGHGTLVVVQPLLVTGLLFALPLGAAWSGRRLGPWDWVAAVLVCAGLAVFLNRASPQPGHTDVRPFVWLLLLASAAGAVLLLVAASKGRVAWQRAVLLSASAGIVYGTTAALTKTSSHLLDGGLLHLLAHWQPWALLVSGVGGMVIAQSAFQAGSLDASLPTMSVVDPVVSIIIGAVAFGESVAAGPGDLAVEVIALAVMSGGIFLLARSEAIRTVPQSQPQTEAHPEPQPAPPPPSTA
jgi:drug/metabolite transporter (DMT)-like permease